MRVIALLGLVGLAGCAEVRPWQRGELAARCMQLSPRPLHDASHAHFLVAREGTRPGGVVGGGGCGCD
jgi:hypothetical protein